VYTDEWLNPARSRIVNHGLARYRLMTLQMAGAEHGGG